MKIYVTCGSDSHKFERIFKMVQLLVKPEDDIVMQMGATNFDCIVEKNNTIKFDFLKKDQHLYYMNNSDLVISHAGAGTLMECWQCGIKPIVLPRLKKYDEHINDHQLEIYNFGLERKILYALQDIQCFNIQGRLGNKYVHKFDKVKDLICQA